MNKLCNKCGQAKPHVEFHRNKQAKDGLQAYCKVCMRSSAKAYYKTDRGKAAIKKGVKKKADEGYFRFGKGAISILKSGADKRGIAFALSADTLENWWKRTSDDCAYCGIKLCDYLRLRDAIVQYAGTDYEIIKYGRFYRSPKHKAIRWMTIDRVDNSVGYTLENMVKSCWICNSLKGDFFTGPQMRSISPLLISGLLSRLGIENVKLA